MKFLSVSLKVVALEVSAYNLSKLFFFKRQAVCMLKVPHIGKRNRKVWGSTDIRINILKVLADLYNEK